MTTKVCPNSKCPAFAHFVYTVAMRCVLCRCDLMPPQRNAEAAGTALSRIDASRSRQSKKTQLGPLAVRPCEARRQPAQDGYQGNYLPPAMHSGTLP